MKYKRRFKLTDTECEKTKVLCLPEEERSTISKNIFKFLLKVILTCIAVYIAFTMIFVVIYWDELIGFLEYARHFQEQQMIAEKMNVENLPSTTGLTIAERRAQAEVRSDLEPIQASLPWLDITSVRWRSYMLTTNYDPSSFLFAPGPTDRATEGVLTVNSDYLKEIRDKFEWRCVGRVERFCLFDETVKEFALERSYEYERSYRTDRRAAQTHLTIDFEKEIVFFSFIN